MGSEDLPTISVAYLRATMHIRNETLGHVLTNLAASGQVARHLDRWAIADSSVPVPASSRPKAERTGLIGYVAIDLMTPARDDLHRPQAVMRVGTAGVAILNASHFASCLGDPDLTSSAGHTSAYPRATSATVS